MGAIIIAPPKKFTLAQQVHVNVEADIKEIGDILGLKPAEVLKRGYFYCIDENLSRIDAPISILEKWNHIKKRDSDDFNKKVLSQKELEKKAKEAGYQKKLEDALNNRLIRVWNIADSKYENIPISQYNPIIHQQVVDQQ